MHQDEETSHQTLEHRLWQGTKETEVPERQIMPLLTFLRCQRIQNWPKIEVRKEFGKKVQVSNLPRKKTVEKEVMELRRSSNR